MPAAVVKKHAPEYADRKGIELDDALVLLEELWDKAKDIAKKKNFKKEDSVFWSYVMGVWKRMSGFTSEATMVPITIEASTFEYSQDDYDDGNQTIYVKQNGKSRKEVWHWPSGDAFYEFDDKQRLGNFTDKALYKMIRDAATLVE